MYAQVHMHLVWFMLAGIQVECNAKKYTNKSNLEDNFIALLSDKNVVGIHHCISYYPS